MDKKLKDLKDEVLVVTNAAEGNTPHVVEDIEPEWGLKTRPLAGAKPSDQFMRIDRNVSILETFFLNMKRQFERPSDFRFYHLPADLLASAKELVGLFKQPESNSALLDEYRLDTEQYVQSRQQAQQQHAGPDDAMGEDFGGRYFGQQLEVERADPPNQKSAEGIDHPFGR